ncbi:flagellar protein FliT [uncultured Azohydromonas sp.]|jgi:Flagellar protein FliT.|uniref:flagellar protein FliT n=1 Tax=uncultured Azohydromonas sp. TaxID=487342 RepID=UPI002607024D|nr:flagellar protein FliT [uncultured Azohydromonas sp.]
MDTPLLSYYEAIEAASANMLAAAQRGDWKEVARLEDACDSLIDELQSVARQTVLAGEQLAARSCLMERILANDAQIRHLAEAWFDRNGAMKESCSHALS